MDCTSDINDVPVFVRPTPTARVLPDDYRLQTLTGSAPGNLRRSSSANHLRLVPVCGSAQRCCPHGTVRTLCYQRRNSSTRSLLSIAEFDGHHSNVDAHSFEIQPTDPCYYSQGDDHGSGREVHLVSLKPDEILSQIRSSPPCCDPVPFQSYKANSAIREVTLTGLHNGKSHISIVEIKFKSGQKIDLSDVKSLTVEILGLDRRTKKHRITGSVISQTSNKICTVLKDILLHMQIFYWKDPFINIRVELLDHNEVEQFSSNSSDAYSNAISPCSHATVIHPRPLIMSTLPDDDRILHNQPLPDTMVCVSGTEAAKFYLVHSHNSGDNVNCRAMQPATNMDANEEMVEVSTDTSHPEQNSFSINLDCKKLYYIINSREMIQYPCTFRMTWSFSNNMTLPIILRILPLKCGGRHISLWAEISSPVPQCLPLHQITVEAMAYNPCKGRICGQLGRSVRCTENLKFSETERCSRCQVSFNKLMLQMHAFYCKRIQIDIKSY